MTEPKRDYHGRYLIVPDDGGKAVPHSRVTTVAKVLDDTSNLDLWKQRHVAKGLADRPDLLGLAAATPLADKGALNAVCSDAIEAAKASSRANLGTALHKVTERLDAGEPVKPPAMFEDDVRAYRECLTINGIEVNPEWIEVVAVCSVLPEPVAGTPDRILRWGGRWLIGDLKTGRDLKWSWRAIAAQLAIYSRSATLYDPETETHSPMPDVDQDHGIVFHLPAGEAKCIPYLVDLNAGWAAAQAACWVREWRRRQDLATPLAEVA